MWQLLPIQPLYMLSMTNHKLKSTSPCLITWWVVLRVLTLGETWAQFMLVKLCVNQVLICIAAMHCNLCGTKRVNILQHSSTSFLRAKFPREQRPRGGDIEGLRWPKWRNLDATNSHGPTPWPGLSHFHHSSWTCNGFISLHVHHKTGRELSTI